MLVRVVWLWCLAEVFVGTVDLGCMHELRA